ncbi:MAG: hypothetical protein ACE5FZ_03350 [Nitrospiria bacterium]
MPVRVKFFLFALLLSIGMPWPPAHGEDPSPLISDLKIHPKKGPAGTVFTLSFRLRDPQGPDDVLKILFQVREGRELIEIVINDDGLNGDVFKGDGIYTGKDRVPETAAIAPHFFEVFTRDKSGHKSNVLKYTFTVLEGVVIQDGRSPGPRNDHHRDPSLRELKTPLAIKQWVYP